jgi:hypothetical protein
MRANKLSPGNTDTIGTRRAEHLTSIIINNGDHEFDITSATRKIKSRIGNERPNLVNHKALRLRTYRNQRTEFGLFRHNLA